MPLRSQSSLTHRMPLTNSRLRFEREKSGRVVFLGGSITAGAGWRDLVGSAIQSRFPQARIELLNAGIPSLGSTPNAFRFEQDACRHGRVDLLTIDAAVNDQVNGFTPLEQIRGMEGTIRRARRLNPAIDVVMLHFAEESMVADYDADRLPPVIANHERVAEHYGVSTVDMPREMSRGIAAGEYSLEQWGGIHPSAFGHELYARNITRLLDASWQSPLAPEAGITPHAMPAPIDARSYFHGRYAPVDIVEPSDGWSLDPAWKPADRLPTRHGFVDVPVLQATRPGATLTLQFQGPSIGLFVNSGADAGLVEFSIDGSPFRTRDLFTHWSQSLHLPWAVMLDGDLAPGNHTLTLRVSESRHSRSCGNAVRIVHFLVNAPVY